MLSRIADSLFWLSRYMERVEGILRASRTHYIYSLDKNTVDGSWKPILQVFSDLPESEIQKVEHDTYAALHCLLLEPENTNSAKNLITRARENARGVQDHITREVWEEVNSIYHLTNRPFVKLKLASSETLEMMDLFMKHSMIYAGVADVTMQRGTGWNVIKLGKFMERCMETLVLTDKQCALFNYDLRMDHDIINWRFLLLSLAGYEAYLKTYRTAKHNSSILHQAIFNIDFPHSILYCLTQIDRSLTKLIKENNSPEVPDLLRTFGKIHSKIRFTDPASLLNIDLKIFFSELKNELHVFNSKLKLLFFSY